MRIWLVSLCVICSACGAQPAPQFFNATRHDITLEDIRFVVFDRGGDAEVIRLGYLGLAERARVPRLMRQAAEQTTGCKVTGPSTGPLRSPSLPGDTGEARFRLRC
ncbi:hypothetical protein ERN12_08740 [Rhodobacteraceae bacterium]|nr:hypothetical protein ERN12_08740 [Paracoccaceae bacterium]